MTGRVNFQENMFVGTAELQQFQKLNYGLIQILGAMTRNFGFIEMMDAIQMSDSDSASLENRKCFKVSASGNGTFTINTPSYAMSWNQNTNKYSIISWTQNRLIQVPENMYGNKYFVKISYAETSIETGTLRIDSDGNVTGTGTKFADLLRGGVDNISNSRINLYTYSGTDFSYVGTYNVQSVNSDTLIKISEEGSDAIPDISKTYYYSIAPTLPLGSYSASNIIYIYDGCKIEFVQTNGEETPNEWLMQVATNEFYICLLDIADNGNITVTDKRFIFEDVEDDTEKIYSKWFKMK